MKVLMVTNMYPSERYPSRGSFIKSQIDSIRRKGIDIEILFIDAWSSRFAYMKAVGRLWRKVRTGSYDIVHAHYGFSGIIARMQWRVPVIVSFCGGDILGNPDIRERRSLSSRIYTAGSQILAHFVPVVIVKSEEMRRRLMKQSNVYVIPNGVDFNKFFPENRSTARKRLGLDPRKKIILFPSNANWIRKGAELARAAVAALNGRHDVEFITLYGQDPATVPVYMNASDAVIMTSMWEGSPNVIKEAMACNIPIVSTDVGDVKEIISDCSGCFIVRRHVKDISRKLHKVLSEYDRTNGREYIEALEIGKIADRIIDLYSQLSFHRRKSILD